jgi:hypothetical protein
MNIAQSPAHTTENFHPLYKTAAQTYMEMAEAGYRAARYEPECEALSQEEVDEYVKQRFTEDHAALFQIYGCTDARTSREFLLLIEAAQLLCAGDIGRQMAIRLIDMAQEGLEK